MPEAMISFHDGEVLYVEIEDLSLDVPVLEVGVRTVDSNSDRALLPLTAIRQIIVGPASPAPDESERQDWERAVFRFLDGQVMRAWISPATRLGRHGGIWECLEPDGDEVQRLAIPYSALKAIFAVRQWDGRSAAERTPTTTSGADRLARILTEREAGISPNPDHGLLNRLQHRDRPR